MSYFKAEMTFCGQKINLQDEDIMKALLPERSGIYLKLCHGRTTDNKGKVSRVMMFS